MKMRLERHPGDIFVLTMENSRNSKNEFENRFDLVALKKMNELLDRVLLEKGRALVVTGGESKFFSNGHDIQALENGMCDGTSHLFITEFYKMLARFMCFPVPTVAAINGHAFAGGCLLAMAQDYRVMREDRGYICMNEIDMAQENATGVVSKIQPGVFKDADKKMTSVLRAKIPSIVLRDMYLKGSRLDAKAALTLGIVDMVNKEVIQASIAMASTLGKKAHAANRRTIAVLKFELSRENIQVLTDSREEELLQGTLSRL